MRVNWIEHQGKQILFVDLRGLLEEQVVQTVDLEARMIAEASKKVLISANVEGASISTMGCLKKSVKM